MVAIKRNNRANGLDGCHYATHANAKQSTDKMAVDIFSVVAKEHAAYANKGGELKGREKKSWEQTL